MAKEAPSAPIGPFLVVKDWILAAYGGKNLGMNYGLVFIGWGLGAFMPKLGGIIQDATGSLDLAFYISGSLLLADAPVEESETRVEGLEEGKAA